MLIRTKRMLKKWIVRCAVFLAVVLLCYVNIHRLNNNIYSNYERAVDYGRVREQKEIVEPVITAVFYKAKSGKKKNVGTYFEHADNYKEKNVKIVVVPEKMTENSLPVVGKLYEEISKHNKIKQVTVVAENDRFVKEHVSLLKKTIKPQNLKTFLLNEADISAEKDIEKFLNKNNTLVVALDDLSKESVFFSNSFLTDEIVWMAQKYVYDVNVFDAIDTRIAKAADKDYETLFSSSSSGDEPLLKKQQRNLQMYVNQYKDMLLKYFALNLSLGLEKETIWPAKNMQTYRLYDRGVVYIRFFGENGKELFARAKVGNNKGVIVAMVELARKAVHKVNQPIKSYKIYLFTDFEPLDQTGNSLVNDLETDDGVYIQYKSRKALMVYDERPQNPQDWLKFLFVRAGIAQNTNRQDIKLFKFKTVEIENEN